MVSIISFQASVVIIDILNKFITKENYSKTKMNKSIIYKNDLKLIFNWFIWGWRLFNRYCRSRKMEMEVLPKYQLLVVLQIIS